MIRKNVLLKFWFYNAVQWSFLLIPEPLLIILILFSFVLSEYRTDFWRMIHRSSTISHLSGLQYHQYSWRDNSYLKICCSIGTHLHCAKQDEDCQVNGNPTPEIPVLWYHKDQLPSVICSTFVCSSLVTGVILEQELE